MPLDLTPPAPGTPGPIWADQLNAYLESIEAYVNALPDPGTVAVPTNVPLLVEKDELTGTWSSPQPTPTDPRRWIIYGSLDAQGNPPAFARPRDVLWIRR